MRKLIIIAVLSCFYIQLSAQVKHEVKISPFSMIGLDFHPSYEALFLNDRIGVELGAGLDFSKAPLRTLVDTILPGELFSKRDNFRSREFKSSLAIKLYRYYEVGNKSYGIFTGPYIEYNRKTFYEDDYFIRQEALLMNDTRIGENFIGEQEIRTGLNSGIKMIFRSNLILELSGKFVVFFEQSKGESLSFTRAYFYLYPAFKVGYQFGGKEMAEVE